MSVDEEWAFGVEGGGVDDEPVLSGEGRDLDGTGLRSDAEVVRGLGEDESVGTHDVDEGVLEFAALDGYGHGAAVVPGLYVGEQTSVVSFILIKRIQLDFIFLTRGGGEITGLGEGFVTGGGNQGCQNQNNGFLHGFCVLFPQN